MADHTSDDPHMKSTGAESAGAATPPQGDQQSRPDVSGQATEPAATSQASGSAAQAPDAAVSNPGPDDAATAHRPGQVLVMSPLRNDSWTGAAEGEGKSSAGGAPRSAAFGKRRLSAFAAVFILALIGGAIGGGLATATVASVFKPGGGEAAAKAAHQSQALDDSIQKLSADIAALKSSIAHSSKLDAAQFAKVTDRIEKVEKAQAEPAAKLAKISETLDKLRVATATPPAASSAKDITGSIPKPASTSGKPEANRLPTVQGWNLRDVSNGSALVEGRDGLYEVYAGDPLPGLGRVDAIRRQDGHWVVVTTRGLIVSR
jgi:hypothetical protein